MLDWIVKYWVQVLFGVVCSLLGGLWTALVMWRKKQRALENGVQALLRDRIIQTCQHYLEAGDMPVYGMENIHSMYSAYHVLGGNGAVTKLVSEVRDLPTRH